MAIAFDAVDELEKSQVSAFKTDGNVAVATLVDDFTPGITLKLSAISWLM